MASKKVKQETDPNKNYVYIIHENQDEIIPSTMDWIKVGMLQASTVGTSDFYGRIRALNQGNPRGVSVAFSVMTHTKTSAARIEETVHKKLKALGIMSRSHITKEAGHSEWFATDVATVQGLIETEYNRYLIDQITMNTNFIVPAPIPVSKTRTKEIKVKMSEADPTLFGGL